MTLLSAAFPISSPLITSLSTVSKFISLISAFALIGTLLAMGFLLLDTTGKLSTSANKLRSYARASALLWFIGTLATIVFTLANVLGQSISVALDLTVLRSFVTQITLGQYLLFQCAIALHALLMIGRIRKVGGAIALLVTTIIGLIAPIFQSHSASSGSHALAIGSLVLHVMALSLWVGGIFTIAILDERDRPIAIPRFSQVALWAAIVVVISGSASAWVRLDFRSAWSSAYAYVVIGKVALTLALIFIGYAHRKSLAERSAINRVALAKLLFIEASIMALTVAMGAWLSSNEAPVRETKESFNGALSVTGITTPDRPNLSRLLFSYEPNALMMGLLLIALALYLKGVMVLNKRGDKWPIGRTIAFALGICAINYATSGGLGLYAHFSFSYHMVAHMFLGMIAPIGIVLGAPITLALRTLPQSRDHIERGVRGTLLAALHSKLGVFYTNPIVVLALFAGSLFALYFTSLFSGMMQSYAGHFFMSIHFILAGYLFFHVIIGIDPNPRKIPHLVRIVILLAAMSIHAFFSVALMSTSTLIDQGYFASLRTPWLTDLLADQRLGGAIGWAMGEIPILLALVATFIQWMRDDSRETLRIDRNSKRLAAIGQPDELAGYNRYLAALAKRDEKEK